ncbi:MAG: SMP-30/gluconolactonase/LRE family protein [Planctomycetota bacterium]
MISPLDGVSSDGVRDMVRVGRATTVACWLLGWLLLVPAVSAEEGMKYPLAAAVGTDGVVYVADRDLPGVWKFADNKWSIHFQGSKKFRTPLNAVRCLAIDHQGKLLAGDSATREIYRFDDAGQPQPLTKGNVGIPMALAVAKDGTIYASDIEIQRIVKIPAEGGEPSEVAELAATRGLAIDAGGRLIAVCHGKNAVIRLSADGKEREVLVEGRPFQFSHHVVLGPNGEAYIADGYAKTIWKVEGKAAPVALIAGEPLKNPVGLAWQGADLLIVDPHLKAVLRRTADGKLDTIGETK